jgi:von Willebrand factor type A domain
MELAFLTPLGALLAASAIVPVAVYVLRQRRTGRMRTGLGLDAPSVRARLPLVLALAAVPALLGVAAAQPVLESERIRPQRTDAEVFVVLDTSRSMLASASSDSPTRFQRARELALRLSNALPDVPVGLASMTDQVLPHVFPTTDRRVISAALYESMGIERPGPSLSFTSIPTTTLDSLTAIPRFNYFAPAARKRVLVVLTDGESRPLEGGLSAAFRKRPAVTTLFVRFWSADERIFEGGVVEDIYRPLQASGALLQQVASQIGGRVFSEADGAAAVAAARLALGTGPTKEQIIEGERRALMPWVTLAAILPLGLVLVRRNV